MGKKEFKFHGLSLDEVKKLSVDEFAHYLPARERRTLKRFSKLPSNSVGRKSNEKEKIRQEMHRTQTEKYHKFMKHIKNNRKNIRTHERDMVIIPEMLGATIKVHTGKDWTNIIIEPDMLGHRLGEFALTRKRLTHSSPGVGATRSSAALSVR